MSYTDIQTREQLENEACEYLKQQMTNPYIDCSISAIEKIQKARDIVKHPGNYKSFYDLYEAMKEVLL